MTNLMVLNVINFVGELNVYFQKAYFKLNVTA